MRRYFLCLLVTAFCLVFPCTGLSATPKPIVIVGDSLSAGYGIDISQGWVALLKQRLQQQGYKGKVINASVSGDTTSNGLKRLDALLKQYPQALYIIELGANDGLRGLNLKMTEQNLAKMIKRIQLKNNTILLLAVRLPPNYGAAYLQQFTQMYSDLAKTYNVALVVNMLHGVDDQIALMQADRLHPNHKAQSIILENIWVQLETLISESKSIANRKTPVFSKTPR